MIPNHLKIFQEEIKMDTNKIKKNVNKLDEVIKKQNALWTMDDEENYEFII